MKTVPWVASLLREPPSGLENGSWAGHVKSRAAAIFPPMVLFIFPAWGERGFCWDLHETRWCPSREITCRCGVCSDCVHSATVPNSPTVTHSRKPVLVVSFQVPPPLGFLADDGLYLAPVRCDAQCLPFTPPVCLATSIGADKKETFFPLVRKEYCQGLDRKQEVLPSLFCYSVSCCAQGYSFGLGKCSAPELQPA